MRWEHDQCTLWVCHWVGTLALGIFGIWSLVRWLRGWTVGKRAFLSKRGRLTLIEAVLSTVPTYYLSLFRLPSGVSDKLEQIMRNFLWKGVDGDGGDHLVSWKTYSRSKKKGGLGIGNLRSKNKALLFKWLWRFPNEQNTL